MPEVRRSFCRFCHANCAMLVTVEDGRVTRVQGDPDDPVFGGYTCIKGRQLPDAHHGPQRLTVSQKRGAGGFSDISTATALDEIASRLGVVMMEVGHVCRLVGLKKDRRTFDLIEDDVETMWLALVSPYLNLD